MVTVVVTAQVAVLAAEDATLGRDAKESFGFFFCVAAAYAAGTFAVTAALSGALVDLGALVALLGRVVAEREHRGTEAHLFFLVGPAVVFGGTPEMDWRSICLMRNDSRLLRTCGDLGCVKGRLLTRGTPT